MVEIDPNRIAVQPNPFQSDDWIPVEFETWKGAACSNGKGIVILLPRADYCLLKKMLKYREKQEDSKKSYVVETIKEQIFWKHLHLIGFKFIQINGEMLRLHKGIKSLDIKYNSGADLWDLGKHTIQPDLTVKTEVVKEVYYDKLQDVIVEFFEIGKAST